MNLELRKVQIKDIVFDTESKIIDGVLHVDPKKLEELVMEDRKVKSVSFDIQRQRPPSAIGRQTTILLPGKSRLQ